MDENTRYIFVFLFICAGIAVWMIHSIPRTDVPKRTPVSTRVWTPYSDEYFEREMAYHEKRGRRQNLRRQRMERLSFPKTYRRDRALASLVVKANKYVALFGRDGKSKKARRMYAVLAHVRRIEVYRRQWRT